MSRIIWFGTLPDGREVKVSGGWDPPLQGYHFTIEERGKDAEEPTILYDNVEDRELPGTRFPATIDHFVEVASSLGLFPPDAFWNRCSQRLGNVIERITSWARSSNGWPGSP